MVKEVKHQFSFLLMMPQFYLYEMDNFIHTHTDKVVERIKWINTCNIRNKSWHIGSKWYISVVSIIMLILSTTLLREMRMSDSLGLGTLYAFN